MKKHVQSIPKLTIITCLVSLALMCYAFSGRKNQKLESPLVKIMSYNIHYGFGTDGKYDLERIAKVISVQNPDIVGLQEIGDSTMAATLGKLTGMNYVFAPSKGSMKKYGDAVLSKHPFVWVDSYSIPSASSSRYQVMGVDVDLSKIYRKNTMIRFLNTHFDYMSTIGSQEARLATVDVIERGFFKGALLPTILTGDLNETPESAPIKKLQNLGWWHESLSKELNTYPAEKPEMQIDYVLVRPRKDWKIIDVSVLGEPIASDHLPILMTIELLAKNE